MLRKCVNKQYIFTISHDVQHSCVCVCVYVDVTVTLDCQVFPLGQMGLETLDIRVTCVK